MTDNILKFAALQENGGLLSPWAEESIALGFAARHEDALRYVAAWGRWLSFDGARWAPDETLHAFDLARAICRETAAGAGRPRLMWRRPRPSPPSSGWPRRTAGWPPPSRNGTPMAGCFNTGDDDAGSCDL